MIHLHNEQDSPLTERERHRLLTLRNDTARDYPLERPLHQLFEAQVERTPDAVALVFEGEQLRYCELDARANQLARYLQAMGVGSGVLVGVSMERSLELVVALLAVLKAGGAYVPLDPSYPRERLTFMLGDARVPVLLSQAALRGSLPEQGARVVCLDADWPQIAGESDEKPEEFAGPDDLAYVIYTSGSTGQPKGVMNAHRAIVNRLLWMQEAYGLGPDDAVVQKTPFSFDVSVWEFFWPLLAGARLVLARPGGHQDSGYLAELVAREKITVAHFVPSMLSIFLDARDLEARCRSLRHVICSGEALTAALVRRFQARLNAELHNLYGPTEAAVDVTHWTCPRDGAEDPVPIGRPVANTQIYLLDDDMQPVRPGDEGELHIGGVQVARGYLNRPDLTAERFVADPFAEEAGARLYKTGDIARYRPDGAIEFLGRRDHQVKVRGFRIELGEIEAVLGGHPQVRGAVVLAREGQAGDRRLVAYYAPRGEDPGVEALRRYLAGKLPDYMMPGTLNVMDSLPLTANGKVDRAALPSPDRKRPPLEQPYAPARSELERFLVGLWSEVLELEQVGIHDKFFELGGTSIQAAQFINRLQRELGEFVYIVTIFENPTVAEYAAFLSRDYGPAVARRFGLTASGSGAPGAGPTREHWRGAIDEDAIPLMERAIPRLPEWRGREVEGKNRPALFILSPPRSGTTLLRVMLAGHPDLFSAAELQLLCFNTLDERKRAFSGKHSLWLEGTVRAIMELEGCDADEAKRMMARYEAEGVTTKAFYRLLQERLGEKLLLDKSPSYVLDPDTLAKAERDFEGAIYLHLVRHPYAMVRSFEGYHMDQVLYLHDHPFSPRQLGELVWTISHRNTLDFLETVPAERQVRLRFEDLVTEPKATMEGMCEALGLDYHPALIEPYQDLDKKMTDGIYTDSTPMGDTKLLERRGIDPKMADSWRGVENDDFLGEPTWRLAETFGYRRPEAGAGGGAHEGSRRSRLQRQRQLRRAHRDDRS